MTESYYYSRMTREKKAVYQAMLEGLSQLKEAFSAPDLGGPALSEVFLLLRLDHPEIFWASGFRWRSRAGAKNVEILPDYLFEKGKIREHQKALAARRDKLIRPALGLTDWEKEQYVHDFICTQVRYDKLKKAYSHEIIGPLGQGVGVCEGIAKAVKLLLDSLGVWCIVVISDNNLQKGLRYRHTWNLVRVGGSCFHLDATFDNTLGKAGARDFLRYDYFNLDDKRIFRDHEPLLFPAEACGEGERFYYREKKLSFTRIEEVYKRCLQAAKKGKPLVFHWRGGALTKETAAQLLDLARSAGEEKGKSVMAGLNWPQAVMQLEYRAGEEGFVLEQANEGEKE